MARPGRPLRPEHPARHRPELPGVEEVRRHTLRLETLRFPASGQGDALSRGRRERDERAARVTQIVVIGIREPSPRRLALRVEHPEPAERLRLADRQAAARGR